MFKLKIMLSAIALLVLAGCAGRSDYVLLDSEKKNQNNVVVSAKSIEYRILPQDRLSISLYKDPSQGSEGATGDLGQRMNPNGILVDTQGYVVLPLIGKVKLAGLSQSQAAARITTRYKKYLNTPSVYLEVMNKRLFVLGEVNKPGVVAIDKEKMTLFEAIASAGDLTDSAIRNEIVILSNDRSRGITMRTVDLTNFDRMNYASLMLRPNDIVYVKPNSWKSFRVASNDFTAPFETITKIAAPFVTLRYLSNN